MKKIQQYFFESIFLVLAAFLFCLLSANRAETRPVDPDDAWKVHISASGHIPGISGIRVQFWWNTAGPEWTYTGIIRCHEFYPDPAPAASKPVNCTTVNSVDNDGSSNSYGEYTDHFIEDGRYHWYKVLVCDSSRCVESVRSSYDLNNGESSHLNGAWLGAETLTPDVPTGITVSKVSKYSVKISWTGNDPRMTDFFQLYRCTTTSMASCEHHPWYDPYHQKYKDYAFNEFYANDGDSTNPGVNYYYRVKACAQGFKNDSSSMRCSALSNYSHYTPPPTSPPPTPGAISASDGEFFDKIVITWSSSLGATYYNLYRESSLIASGNVTSYEDERPTIRPERHYNYSVAACNSLGCSEKSKSDRGYLRHYPSVLPGNLLLLLKGKMPY